MSNNLHLLGKLKEKLINDENFSETMRYFFDNFADHASFIRLGSRYQSRLVETIVTEAASSALGTKAIVSDLILTRLYEQKFCHGPCTINGRMAMLFYFEDIRTGLLAIILSNPGETRYTRITAVSIQKDRGARWN